MALPLYDPEQIPKHRGWSVAAVYKPQLYSAAFLGALDAIDADPLAPGHSDVGVKNLLFNLILSLRPEAVIEVGGHIGSATVVMGEALRLNGYGSLYTIEPQEHYFNSLTSYVNQAGVSPHVNLLNGMSNDIQIITQLEKIAPAELIFLDACHDFDAVMADLDIFTDLLSENGIIVCHDSSLHGESFDSTGKGGVRRAITEYCRKRKDLVPLFLEYPLWLNNCGCALLCKQSIVSKSGGAMNSLKQMLGMKAA